MGRQETSKRNYANERAETKRETIIERRECKWKGK